MTAVAWNISVFMVFPFGSVFRNSQSMPIGDATQTIQEA